MIFGVKEDVGLKIGEEELKEDKIHGILKYTGVTAVIEKINNYIRVGKEKGIDP